MHCTQCGTESPSGAKFCLECGSKIADPASSEAGASERTGPRQGDAVAGGIVAFLCLFVLSLPFIWLYSCISTIGDPTPEEQQAATAQFEEDARRDAAREEQFKRAQQSLWAAPSDTLTKEVVLTEISKCKQDIERGGSPYAWMYDDVDATQAIEAVRQGRPVLLTVEHRLDSIGERSVEWAQYYCSFKGAGYERVEKDPNVRYTKNYMPSF